MNLNLARKVVLITLSYGSIDTKSAFVCGIR